MGCVEGWSSGRGASRRVGGWWVGAGTVFKRKEEDEVEEAEGGG